MRYTKVPGAHSVGVGVGNAPQGCITTRGSRDIRVDGQWPALRSKRMQRKRRVQAGKDDGEKGGGLFDWWRSSDDDNSRFSQKARDEMFEAQQAILRERKSGKAIDRANERRRAVSKKVREEKAGIKKKTKVQYDDEPENSIPIPLASFGMPKFDYGERFDLKGPYVDEGYVDEDADIMKKISNFFRGSTPKDDEDNK